MAKDFEIYRSETTINMITLTKASATVIEPGDMVALSSGVAIKAVAASTAIAFCPDGWVDGETEIQVVGNPDTLYLGTADANFAVTDKGIECDLVGTTTLLVDLGASTTDVFKVYPGTNAEQVAGATPVLVRINKMIS